MMTYITLPAHVYMGGYVDINYTPNVIWACNKYEWKSCNKKFHRMYFEKRLKVAYISY